MASGRNLTVYLTSDTSKFRKGLKGAEDRLTRFRRNAGQVLSGVGVGVAAGIAAGAVAIGDAVQKASDLNEAISKANVIFGDSAKGLITWADGADKAMGLSQRAALDVAGTFGAIGKQAGMSQPKAASFAKQLAQMAGDLASMNNTSVEEAATALASGLRGEAEPLRKFNINLSESAVQAEALSSGLVKAEKDTTKVKRAQLTALRAQDTYNTAVKKYGANSKEASRASMEMEIAQENLGKVMQGTVPKMTDAEKVAARLKIIFKQGKDATGDYARTADGLANTQRTVVSQIEDIQADFGTGFIEGLGGIDDASTNAKDSLADMEENAGIVGKAIGQLAADALQAAANFAIGLQAIPTLWDTFVQNISGGVTTIGDKLGLIDDQTAQYMQDNYADQIKKNNERLNQIVNPAPAAADPYADYSQYRPMRPTDPVRYNKRRQDADTRAARRAAASRKRP